MVANLQISIGGPPAHQAAKNPEQEGASMVVKLTFFPVDNGDMTLIELESGRKILIDMNIRAAADDPDDDTLDVAKALRDRLTRDAKDRLYGDAGALIHPVLD